MNSRLYAFTLESTGDFHAFTWDLTLHLVGKQLKKNNNLVPFLKDWKKWSLCVQKQDIITC